MKDFLNTKHIWRNYFWILINTAVFLLISFSLSAIHHPVRNYTLRDGLPDKAIQAIYKDSRGLLWIGTQSGLSSYDGKSFRIYLPSEGMTASQIWSIAEDGAGNMWFGSMGEGLFRYDGKNFTRYTDKDGLVDNRIRVLCYSKKFGCMVAGSYDGVNIIRKDTILKFENKKHLDNYGTITGMADSGDFILISEYGKRRHFRLYPGENRLVVMENDGDYYPANSFSCYISSKGDTLISDEYSGVKIYHREGVTDLNFPGQIFSITEDKRGDLWMASWAAWHREYDGGIFRYDGKNVRNYKNIFGIDDREIWTLCYDPEQDILWIGTLNQGLFMVQFPLMTHYTTVDFGLEAQKINNLFVDSGNRLWISAERELIALKPDGTYSFLNEELLIPPFRKYWQGIKREVMPFQSPLINGLLDSSGNDYSDLLKQHPFKFDKVTEYHDGSLGFSCEPGTFLLDKLNGQFKYVGLEGYLREFTFVGDTMISAGSEGTSLFVDFRKPVSEVFAKKEDWKQLYRYFDENYNPRNVNRIFKKGNAIWYASSSSGLWMSRGMRLVNFNRQDTTISSNLRDICVDEEGRIIFASATGEICMADLVHDSLVVRQRINAAIGLQGSSINWIALAGDNKLWVGTNKGLNLIDLEKVNIDGAVGIRFLDEEDGYSGQASRKAVVDLERNLWIADIDQLIRINTSDFNQVGYDTGDIIFKSLEIYSTFFADDDSTSVTVINKIPEGSFKLSHNESDLIFNFDKNNFRNPEKDFFRYRLLGYNENPTSWSQSRRAVFTNLSPGEYTLIIESHNLMTNSYSATLELGFTIRHPLWGLWYLQIPAALLLIKLLIFMIRKYVKRERIKQQAKSDIEKKIVRLEMQALQAQMNPHFIFNCVNGIQYYVLANKMDEVLAYLSDFSKVVRESLENATQRVVPLDQEIVFLHSYLRLELMRFPDKFDYGINFRDGIQNSLIMIPPMLIQPFVENAIRHGFMQLDKKGSLSVLFEKAGIDVLKCTITDNGIGRSRSQLSSRNDEEKERLHSARITETRLRLFNPPGETEKYRIVFTDLEEAGHPAGLKVELHIPMEIA
jgi:ligand-binding sensor domain-containing protein